MTKFKVGDVVERTDGGSCIWQGFTEQDSGPYVVTKALGGWLQINGYTTCSGRNTRPFAASGFELVEQDDPLPTAPESVRYYNSFIMGNNDQNLTVEPAPEYPGEGLLRLLITPNSHSTRNVTPLSINMDPDAVLQLAHDLNRMANEIKRRERAQSGE